MKTTARLLATALFALTMMACGGADDASPPANDDQEGTASDELRTGRVVLEIRDDGDVHATGLRGASGPAWDHFVKPGDRITLRNRSSKSVFAVVTYLEHFTDGRPHLAVGNRGVLVRRELRAGTGETTWKVPGQGWKYSVNAYADASQETELLGNLVNEPDQESTSPVTLDVSAQ